MKVRILSFCAVVLAVCSLTASRAVAQTPPPGVSCDPGWLLLSITTNIDLGFPCPPFMAEVWFCMPDPAGAVTPKEMIIIKAVRKLGGGTFPCPLTGAAIRSLGELIMFGINPGGWTVPVNCSEWCEQHPECPCPSEYPQWVAANGSCGKLVPEGDSISVVMCGEIGGEGQNCFYAYHVCKNSSGGMNWKWVSKKTPANCPGFGMSSECVMPLCDNEAYPTPDPPDTCKPDDSSSVAPPVKPEISGVGMVSNGNRAAVEAIPVRYFDKGTRKENE